MCLIFKYIHNRRSSRPAIEVGDSQAFLSQGLVQEPLNNETIFVGKMIFPTGIELGSTSNRHLQTFLLHQSKNGNHYYLVHTFLDHVLKVFERNWQADSLWLGLLKFRLQKESSV